MVDSPDSKSRSHGQEFSLCKVACFCGIPRTAVSGKRRTAAKKGMGDGKLFVYALSQVGFVRSIPRSYTDGSPMENINEKTDSSPQKVFERGRPVY
jgi:hypothetical protein